VPNGKTPLPTRAGDEVALGLDSGTPAPAAAPGVAALPGAPGGAPAAPDGVDTPALTGTSPAGALSAPAAVEGIDMAALSAPGIKRLHAVGGGARPKVAFALSRKDGGWLADEPDARTLAALEAELTTALSALAERWVERAAVRVGSQKMVKGTRHWEAQFEHDTRIGIKALDTAKAVDEETWEQEAEEAVSPIITAAAIAAAVLILTNMDVTPPINETLREMATRLVREVIGDVVRLIGRSAARQARALIALANNADQDDKPLREIRDLIRDRVDNVKGWAEGVSVVASTGTINGARDAAADGALLDDETLEIKREWITRLDDRVRGSHKATHGQARSMRDPFIVGESLLRFPGDPLAPIHETANCRCRLRYRHRRTGRFVSIPSSAVM
jgi:hypothetical protein